MFVYFFWHCFDLFTEYIYIYDNDIKFILFFWKKKSNLLCCIFKKKDYKF